MTRERERKRERERDTCKTVEWRVLVVLLLHQRGAIGEAERLNVAALLCDHEQHHI